jgi:hypothetical protein
VGRGEPYATGHELFVDDSASRRRDAGKSNLNGRVQAQDLLNAGLQVLERRTRLQVDVLGRLESRPNLEFQIFVDLRVLSEVVE